MSRAHGAQPEKADWTKHRCRWCRREFRAPRYSRPADCPDCAPSLLDDFEPAQAVQPKPLDPRYDIPF